MRELKGYKLDALPIDGLEKVSNLIEFDGPLLAHYRDRFNKQYLFYWVDGDEKANRWLVWEVQLDFLFLYLGGEITLRNLFPVSSDSCFSVDMNSKAIHEKVIMLYTADVPDEYFPEENTFFVYELPEEYETDVNNVEYLMGLKEKALYIDLKSRSNRHARTIGVPDVKQAIDNITRSLSAFISYGVKKELSEQHIDDNWIKKIASQLSTLSRFRVVYLNLNSFHIGIAADNLNTTTQGVHDAVAEYQHHAIKLYQRQILDNDFTDQKDIDLLIEKIPDAQARQRIFDPLIKVINNDNIELHMNDYAKVFDRSYSHVPKSEVSMLIPPSARLKDEHPVEHELMVAYFVADKKGDQISLFPKESSGFLSLKPAKSLPIELEKIILPTGEEKVFLSPIETELVYEDDLLILNYEPLNLFITGKTPDQIKEAAAKAIGTVLFDYLENEHLEFANFFQARPML